MSVNERHAGAFVVPAESTFPWNSPFFHRASRFGQFVVGPKIVWLFPNSKAGIDALCFLLIPTQVFPKKNPGHLFWWGPFQTLAPSLRSNQKSRTRVLVATGTGHSPPASPAADVSVCLPLQVAHIATLQHSNQARLAAHAPGVFSRLQTLKLDQVSDRRYRDLIRSSISDPNFQPQRSVEKATSLNQTLQAIRICPGSSLVDSNRNRLRPRPPFMQPPAYLAAPTTFPQRLPRDISSDPAFPPLASHPIIPRD